MNWPAKKIEEVIELKYGKGISKFDRKSDGRYPVYGANGILDHSDKYLIEGDAIIVGRKGSAGEVTRVSGRFWPSDVTYYALGNNKIDIDYLFYLLKSLNLQRFAVGVKPGINRNRVYEIEISLPPIDEQKKIVAKLEKLLEKIKEAKRLRAEAQEATQNLLPAKLYKLFNAKSATWADLPLAEIATDIQPGFACAKANEVSDGVIHLRTHNVALNGELNLKKSIKIPKSLVMGKAYGLKAGDIIFNNTNSTELVGKTILIRNDLPYAFSNHLTRIRFDNKRVLPSWILYIFQKLWRDKYFEHICTRWVGQSGVNKGSLSKIKIPLPPLSEQQKIVERLDSLSEKINKIKEYQQSTETDLENLEQAILHKAFKH